MINLSEIVTGTTTVPYPTYPIFRLKKDGIKISIPLKVLVHVMKNKRISIGALRTFVGLKYYCTISGDGRYDIKYNILTSLLRCTKQTIYNHIRVLKNLGWITDTFIRGWKRILILCGNTNKTYQVVSLNERFLSSNRLLKSFTIYSSISYSNKVQTYFEYGDKGKTAKIGAIKPKPLSARKIGEWFDRSVMSGSTYRKQLLELGLINMCMVFSLTDLNSIEVSHLRSYEPDISKNLILLNKTQSYVFQECNLLSLRVDINMKTRVMS